MKGFEIIEKHEGETPLQALERYRAEHPNLSGVPLTYAGRLDPMASGALLILMGETCKRKADFTSLDKEYEFEVLFGASTDTGDVLGLITEASPNVEPILYDDAVREGSYRLPYPAYSSKTVRGIPLFKYALEQRLDDIRIPETEMDVRSVSFIGAHVKSGDIIRSRVYERLDTLTGSAAVNDFRVHKVRAAWDDLPDGAYTVARYRAVVSSGTYIRTLSELAGKNCGVPALAYSIRRTRFIGLPSA